MSSVYGSNSFFFSTRHHHHINGRDDDDDVLLSLSMCIERIFKWMPSHRHSVSRRQHILSMIHQTTRRNERANGDALSPTNKQHTPFDENRRRRNYSSNSINDGNERTIQLISSSRETKGHLNRTGVFFSLFYSINDKETGVLMTWRFPACHRINPRRFVNLCREKRRKKPLLKSKHDVFEGRAKIVAIELYQRLIEFDSDYSILKYPQIRCQRQ